MNLTARPHQDHTLQDQAIRTALLESFALAVLDRADEARRALTRSDIAGLVAGGASLVSAVSGLTDSHKKEAALLAIGRRILPVMPANEELYDLTRAGEVTLDILGTVPSPGFVHHWKKELKGLVGWYTAQKFEQIHNAALETGGEISTESTPPLAAARPTIRIYDQFPSRIPLDGSFFDRAYLTPLPEDPIRAKETLPIVPGYRMVAGALSYPTSTGPLWQVVTERISRMTSAELLAVAPTAPATLTRPIRAAAMRLLREGAAEPDLAAKIDLEFLKSPHAPVARNAREGLTAMPADDIASKQIWTRTLLPAVVEAGRPTSRLSPLFGEDVMSIMYDWWIGDKRPLEGDHWLYHRNPDQALLVGNLRELVFSPRSFMVTQGTAMILLLRAWPADPEVWVEALKMGQCPAYFPSSEGREKLVEAAGIALTCIEAAFQRLEARRLRGEQLSHVSKDTTVRYVALADGEFPITFVPADLWRACTDIIAAAPWSDFAVKIASTLDPVAKSGSLVRLKGPYADGAEVYGLPARA